MEFRVQHSLGEVETHIGRGPGPEVSHDPDHSLQGHGLHLDLAPGRHTALGKLGGARGALVTVVLAPEVRVAVGVEARAGDTRGVGVGAVIEGGLGVEGDRPFEGSLGRICPKYLETNCESHDKRLINDLQPCEWQLRIR